MNTKSVLAHLLLALGGLTLAYLVWTDDEAAPAPGEVTIFKSLGLAVEDVAAAHLAYTRAVAQGLGTEVQI